MNENSLFLMTGGGADVYIVEQLSQINETWHLLY